LKRGVRLIHADTAEEIEGKGLDLHVLYARRDIWHE
jgi:hypothetical protein